MLRQVWAGCADAVRALVSYDASLTSCNLSYSGDWIGVRCAGCTPLHLAAVRGSSLLARLLLAAYVSARPCLRQSDKTVLRGYRYWTMGYGAAPARVGEHALVAVSGPGGVGCSNYKVHKGNDGSLGVLANAATIQGPYLHGTFGMPPHRAKRH